GHQSPALDGTEQRRVAQAGRLSYGSHSEQVRGEAQDSRAAGLHREGDQSRSESVELPSKPAANRTPQLRRVDPHREATRDSRTAHPRIGHPPCGGQEARSEVGIEVRTRRSTRPPSTSLHPYFVSLFKEASLGMSS